jgi:long-chain acyl-CoA synthetase
MAKAKGVQTKDFAELVKHPAILAAVDSAVKARNNELSNFETIKKYQVLDKDFTIENNELTPTMKIRRKVVTERYKAILDSFYDAEDIALESVASKN